VSEDPVFVPADLLGRARSLHESGLHVEAEAALLGAIGAGVRSVEALTLLADIESALKRPTREARALEEALAVVRDGSQTAEAVHLWTRLGAIRAKRGDMMLSVAAYERAVQIDPDNFESQRGLARSRLALQDLEGAKRCARELERRFPESAFAHLFAGHIHKAFGDKKAACESYLRALERDNALGEALYNLVDLAPPEPTENVATLAAELDLRDDLSPADRINVGFANARILDRAGRYADAFKHLRKANDLAKSELRHREIEYLPNEVETRISSIMADYPPESFHSTLTPLSNDISVIFVVGLPRSGTTLVEQILASHSRVQAGGELLFARECEQQFRALRSAAGRVGPIDSADPFDAELLASARERYIDSLFERNLDGPWIVDKLPANFEIAGFLRLLFPDSHLIHCRRDPRATCFSLYSSNFGAHEPWNYDLQHLTHYFGQYQRLMAHWSRVIPAPFTDVIYEELVRNPDSQIPALLMSLGLPMESACLSHYRHQRPILTASHDQVRQPIYTHAISHWRHYAEFLEPLQGLQSDSSESP